MCSLVFQVFCFTKVFSWRQDQTCLYKTSLTGETESPSLRRRIFHTVFEVTASVLDVGTHLTQRL
jgi:hypothetical protein